MAARKQLANVRVVQKNLVYVLGLPPKLASEEVSASFITLFILMMLDSTIS